MTVTVAFVFRDMPTNQTACGTRGTTYDFKKDNVRKRKTPVCTPVAHQFQGQKVKDQGHRPTNADTHNVPYQMEEVIIIIIIIIRMNVIATL